MHQLLKIHSICRLYLVAVVFFLFYSGISAQTVIGGEEADESAILDLQDTARGLLLPRLTTVQRNAMVKPATGLLILNTTKKCMETNVGTPNVPNWKCVTIGVPQISDADTLSWNRKLGASDTLSLSNRIATKLTATDTASLSNRINTKLGPNDTLSISNRINTKLGPNDTLSISNRIDAKLGLPPSGNNLGNMLYWNGTSWVRLAPGLPGQLISLSPEGIPVWTGAALASLTTNTATSITPTSATVSGNITTDGGANISARGIVWGTTTNPTLSASVLNLGSGTGAFSGTLSGLSPNTTYYIRAFATNSAGTAYGNQESFSTLAIAVPQLSTNSIASITQTTAIAGGNISGDGGAPVTQRGVVYGTAQNPTLSNAFTQDGSGIGNFTSTLSGLSPNTTYYVRAYATNSIGTAYGNQQSFVTQVPAIPSLTTRDVTNVTNVTATSGGTITNDGGNAITARGVVWSTNPNPTLSDNKTIDGTGAGTYPSFITGLAAGITYYVRAYATNSTGTGYGNQLSFTTALTSNTAAVVQTQSVSDILLQQVTVNADVTAEGGGTVTERGIVWNATGNPTVNSNRITNGSGIGTYSTNITGLTGGTKYYVRAYAVNAFGIAYGQELEFTTAFGVPLVTTNPSLTGTDKTIQGGGNVTEAGGSTVTERGLAYSTTPNPTISNDKTASGSGLGAFTATITGLNGNTTYYIRAYATNSSGTGYGNQVSFTTDATETPGPSFTDIDGNTYQSMQIGSQTWATSNLKTSRYRNGDPIPYVVGDSEWQTGTSGKWSYYNHDEANNVAYGKLYNGHTVADPRGLCPEGWRVPDLNEVEVLSTHLGGDAVAGGKLKALTLWNSPNIGATNSTGFAAVPGGSRAQGGSFTGLGSTGIYWGREATTAYSFSNGSAGLSRPLAGSLLQGNAVRCLKNSVPTMVTRTVFVNNSSEAFSGGENISDAGGGAISEKGVVWSTTPNPTVASNKTTNGSGTDRFSSTITSLVAGITYYVRAYATNSLGTGYGNELSFVFTGTQDQCGAYIAPGIWKQFMCHNLGAANPSADPFTPSWEINGGYWQWGRKEMAAPGPSGPAENQANPGSIAGWNSSFAPNGSWSDAGKTNNDPCPAGFRVPTRDQWQGVINNNVVSNVGSSWTSSNTNYTTGKRFGDNLFLPAAGYRLSNVSVGALFGRGSFGFYWSSSDGGTASAWCLFFSSGGARTSGNDASANGFSLRCISE